MKWEDDNGPDCTRTDALEQFRRLMDAWPTAQFRDVPRAIAVFADRIEAAKLPLRYVRAAVNAIIDEGGDYFPGNPSGEVINRVLTEIWPPKDYTREMRKIADAEEARRGGADGGGTETR